MVTFCAWIWNLLRDDAFLAGIHEGERLKACDQTVWYISILVPPTATHTWFQCLEILKIFIPSARGGEGSGQIQIDHEGSETFGNC
jgi:hypothetical protein